MMNLPVAGVAVPVSVPVPVVAAPVVVVMVVVVQAPTSGIAQVGLAH